MTQQPDDQTEDETKVQTGGDTSRRATILSAAALLGGAGFGAYVWRRYGLTGKLLNPLSASAFDLPALTGLVDAAGVQVPGFSAAEIQGKTVYLNAFASWCPQCREEHEALLEFARGGAEIYGIASLDEPSQTLQYLREKGNPFSKVGVDRKGWLHLALGARGIPSSFVLAPAPKIVFKQEGPMQIDALREKILPLLKQA
jgi:cytochrome c biogenesis protein CcmG/thiol:disulfide interchange protein DsbE